MADPTTDAAGVMPGDEHSSQEIERRAAVDQYAVQVMPLMSDDEIRRTWRLALALSASRMFKDSIQAEQAFAKILLGRDLGLSPTQAMTGIHIVEGKPEIAAVTLASFVRRMPGISYRVVEHTDEACEIHFFEGEELLGVSRFTKEDGVKAGLHKPTRNGQPSNHTKYPRNMNFARAMSNGVKWFVPEATGGIPVYFEGEIQHAAIEAPAEEAEESLLPGDIADMVARAHALDPKAWRENEVLARLDGTPEVEQAVREELGAWLDEHEPDDAEVVDPSRFGEPYTTSDGSDDPNRASAEAAGRSSETNGHTIEQMETNEGVQARYESDEEWRTKVDVLLHRRADLEGPVDSAHAEEVDEELELIEKHLDDLGVPRGWMPVAEGQSTLGV